jgi:hypothetical protein
MRKQISWLSVLSCLLLLVASCASIVGKSVYPVAITSQPDQADISITDETGKTIFTGKTPTTVTLNTKAGYFSGKDYTVTFTRSLGMRRTRAKSDAGSAGGTLRAICFSGDSSDG